MVVMPPSSSIYHHSTPPPLTANLYYAWSGDRHLSQLDHPRQTKLQKLLELALINTYRMSLKPQPSELP